MAPGEMQLLLCRTQPGVPAVPLLAAPAAVPAVVLRLAEPGAAEVTATRTTRSTGPLLLLK